MLTYRQFAAKYDPPKTEFYNCCLPQEKDQLEGQWMRMIAEKRTWGIVRPAHQLFDLLAAQIDFALNAHRTLPSIHYWESIKVKIHDSTPYLLGTRDCGRLYYQVVGSDPTAANSIRAMDALDDFLYLESCDACGGKIFPGIEESNWTDGGVQLFRHPDCPIPTKRYSD